MHSTSNNTLYRNIQYVPTPINSSEPTGPRNDLSSLQLLNNITVFTTYGVDYPVPGLKNVYQFNSSGIITGADDVLNILAWGYDSSGTEWYASYSTITTLLNLPASVDVLSRKDNGPTRDTFEAIKCALRELGNADLSKLVDELVAIKQDGARDGEAPIVCDDYCKTNQDLLLLFWN